MAKSTSLTGLPQKKITTGLKRLQEAGLTPDLWLQMLDARPSELKRIVASMGRQESPPGGVVYDVEAVSRILGLPCECDDPVPVSRNYGEVVIYYGGWDLPTLCRSVAGEKYMRHDHNWYEEKGWKAEPGYYHVYLRVFDSNRFEWSEKEKYLNTIGGWRIAPVTIAATALLVHLAETSEDLLRNDLGLCQEPGIKDHQVSLSVDNGRMVIWQAASGWTERCWLSAVRKS